MDGRTLSTLTGKHFPIVAGSLSGEPYPFVLQLSNDCAALRESHAQAEAYAHSLEEALGKRRAEPQGRRGLLSRIRARLALR
jgi:hypothetical protein